MLGLYRHLSMENATMLGSLLWEMLESHIWEIQPCWDSLETHIYLSVDGERYWSQA